MEAPSIEELTALIRKEPTNVEAYISRGEAFLASEEWARARADFSKAIELSPNDPTAFALRAQANYNLDDLESAIADCNICIKLDSEYSDVFWCRGNVHYDRGEYEQAIQDYTTQIKLDSEPDGIIFELRAQSYIALEQWEHAKSDLSKTIQLLPEETDALCLRAQAYFNLGDMEGAIADCNAALRLDPKTLDAYFYRGHANLEREEYEKAIEDFTKLVQLDPEPPPLVFEAVSIAYFAVEKYALAKSLLSKRIQSVPNEANLFALRAQAHYGLDDLESTINDCNTCLKLQPDFSEAYFFRGRAHLDREEYESAIDDFTKLIELSPEALPAAFELLSAAYFGVEKYELAKSLLSKRIQSVPNEVNLFALRAEAHLNLGDLESTIADCNTAIQLDPQCLDAYFFRGRAHLEAEKYELAAKDFLKLVQIDPDPTFLIYELLSTAYFALEEYEQAKLHLSKRIQSVPNEPNLLAFRAEANYNLSDLESTIDDCTTCIKLEPEYIDAYYFRGRAHLDREEYLQAAEDFTKLLQLDPEPPTDFYELRLQVYFGLEQWELAISDVSKLIEDIPENALLFALRGQAYYNLEKLDSAIADCSVAIRLDPTNVMAYFYRGFAHFEREEYELAIQDLTQKIKLDAVPDPLVYQLRGRAHLEVGSVTEGVSDLTFVIANGEPDFMTFFSRGVAYLNLGKFDAGIQDLSRSINMNPEFADAYLFRGEAHFLSDKTDAAKRDFSEKIRLNPDDPEGYEWRALTYNADPDAAIADTTRALNLDRTRADAWLFLGHARRAKSFFSGALLAYDEAMKLNPELALWADRGEIYHEMNEWDKAISELDKAIQHAPNDAAVYFGRGRSYLQKARSKRANKSSVSNADLQTAIADFTKAIQLEPEYIDALHWRALAYAEAKDYPAAIRDEQTAMKLLVDDPEGVREMRSNIARWQTQLTRRPN